jgi:hypothetical protein
MAYNQAMAALRLGELLIQYGKITPKQLEEALARQKIHGGKLGTNLTEMKLISDLELAAFLSHQLQLPAAKPQDFERIPPQVLELIPPEIAGRHKIMPLRCDDKLWVAVSDPRDLSAIDEISFRTGRPIQAMIAPETWLIAALERYYALPRSAGEAIPLDASDGFVGEVVHEVAAEIELEPMEGPTGLSPGEYGQLLLDATSAGEIVNGLFVFLAKVFPRMALYQVREGKVRGWHLYGFPVRATDFSQLTLALASARTFSHVAEQRSPVYGPLAGNSGDQPLIGVLDIAPQQSVAIYPIALRQTVIGLWLGTPAREWAALPDEVARQVDHAVKQAALALEISYLRRHIEKAAGLGKG